MPIYIYACSDCHEEWKESHGMHEKIEQCQQCESENVHRKPSLFSNFSKRLNKKQKVGSHVKEFIENSKKELGQQKKELKEKT